MLTGEGVTTQGLQLWLLWSLEKVRVLESSEKH